MNCCENSLSHSGCLSESLDEERVLNASTRLDSGELRTEFVVPAMHCASCISKIEKGMAALPFVSRARANLSQKKVTVEWKPDAGNGGRLEETLSSLGYEHSLFDPDTASESDRAVSRELLVALAVAGFAAGNIMLLSVSVWSGAEAETRDLFHLLSGLIAAPAIFIAGRPFFRSALKALSAGRLNMDVPISLAVTLAFAMSLFETLRGGEEVYFDASITLLFFLLIGRYLDHMMRERARGAILRLARLSPRGASRLGDDGELHYVEVDDIRPGMRLRIAPGERIAVDGRIVAGASDIDRSLVTGESMPVSVASGAIVEAGTLNLSGPLDITAERDAKHSFLAEVLQMMEVAENGRGQFVRIADRMAAIYAPAVHLLALAAFLGWLAASGGDWHYALFVAISVLIVTCPCALGLAVPVVHVVGAGRLFANGILMRDGSALERLAQADTAVFDKTGTLTTGTPCVEHADFPDARSAALARSLAMHSSHPASRALRGYLVGETVGMEEVREFPGFGIAAQADGKRIRLGRAAWVNEIADGPDADTASGLAFAIEGDKPVPIRLSEQLRPGANACIDSLKERGMTCEILSGDGKAAVEAVATRLGIEHFSHGLAPKEKLARLEELAHAGRKTLMVGDGLNDAPALAAGSVSFAPASASDVGRTASDFVFTRDSLTAIPFAVGIARRADRLVRQNFGLAIAYNCIAVPLALAGYITPLIAAIAMSASSIVVVSNSMRLNLRKDAAGLQADATEQSNDLPKIAAGIAPPAPAAR